MSTMLWLSLGRSTAVVVVLLTASTVTHAADIFDNMCVSQKLRAASMACNQIFRAWMKAPPTGDDPYVDAAVVAAADTLATRWSRAEQFDRDGSCAQSAPTSDAVQSAIASAAGDISGSVKAGVDLQDSTDVTCRMARVLIAGSLCSGLLLTDSLDARGLPAFKLDKRRSKLSDGLTAKLAARACAGGATPDEIVAAINALEAAVITATQTPPAP